MTDTGDLRSRVEKLEKDVAEIKATIPYKLDALERRLEKIELRLGIATFLGMFVGQVVGRLL